MTSFNPDAAERFQWRYERACAAFLKGGSEAVFKGSFYAIGYRGARLEDEVRYQLCLRGGEVKRVVNSGLPERPW